MKKWKEYTSQEQKMWIILGLLIIAVIFSWDRVTTQLQVGLDFITK